jgi:hypothetical protein
VKGDEPCGPIGSARSDGGLISLSHWRQILPLRVHEIGRKTQPETLGALGRNSADGAFA